MTVTQKGIYIELKEEEQTPSIFVFLKEEKGCRIYLNVMTGKTVKLNKEFSVLFEEKFDIYTLKEDVTVEQLIILKTMLDKSEDVLSNLVKVKKDSE